MKSLTVYVGLDYFTWAWTTTKAASPVCVERTDGAVLMNSRCENDWRVIARRVSTVGAPVQAAIEACGGAADPAEELARKDGRQ